MIDMFWLYTPGAEPTEEDRAAIIHAQNALVPWARGYGRDLTAPDRAWNQMCDEADAMLSGALPSEF